MTPEDDIELEIDIADQTKEKVCSAINDIDQALDQAGKQVIPASVNLPSENPAQPACTTRGSTLSHSPHSSPEDTPPPIDSHVSDTHCHSESSTSIHTLPTDTSTVISQPRVKLLKLTIKKFNGDLTKWVTF